MCSAQSTRRLTMLIFCSTLFINRSTEPAPNMVIAQAPASNQDEILKKHFPDWEECLNFQKKQENNYKFAIN